MYYPLHSAEIRVVDILPGRWEDKICCQLRHTPMANKPSYKALSYVWGAPKAARRSIILNGNKHPVTVNLDSALKRIRETGKVVTFWIDALCINQSDNGERSNQVRLMRSIYAQAEAVVVYLGEVQQHNFAGSAKNKIQTSERSFFYGDDRDAEKIATFRRYCRSKDGKKGRNEGRLNYGHEVFCFISSLAQNTKLANTPPFDDDSQHHSESFYQRNLFEALRYLMRSDWWNRIWVVQEVVVPKNITLLYGSTIASWNMVVNAATSYSLNQLSSTISSFPREYSSVLALFSRIVLGIHEMRGRWQSGEETALLSLLRQFGHRKATDDRDKVYALLGLIQVPPPASRVKVLPDYSHNTVTVFRNTVLSIIENTGSLDVLTGDIGRKNRQDLPSWLPDWSATFDDLDRRRAEDTKHYNATGNFTIFTENQKEKEYDRTARHSQRVDAGTRRGCELDLQYSDLIDHSRILYFSEWHRYAPNLYGDCDNTGFLEGITKCLAAERNTACLRDHDGILECSGLYEGKVVVVGGTCFSSEDLATVVRRWGIQIGRFFKNKQVTNRANEIGPSFLRTICADIMHPIGSSYRRRVIDEDLGDIAAWMLGTPNHFDETREFDAHWKSFLHDIVVPDSAESPEVRASVDSAIRAAVLRRRLFITDTGHIGLGPAGLQLDDELYVLLGARAPFILRQSAAPIPSEVGGQEPGDFLTLQGFQMIGDCYAHGLMDGEALGLWKSLAQSWLSLPEHKQRECLVTHQTCERVRERIRESEDVLEEIKKSKFTEWSTKWIGSLIDIREVSSHRRVGVKIKFGEVMDKGKPSNLSEYEALEWAHAKQAVDQKIQPWLERHREGYWTDLQNIGVFTNSVIQQVKDYKENLSQAEKHLATEMGKTENISWGFRRQIRVFLV